MPSIAPEPSSLSPQILVLIGIAHALVIYRAVAMALFTQSEVSLLSKHADTIAVMTGAVLHYLTIIIMTKVRSHTGCLAGFLHGQTLTHSIPLSCRSTGKWPSFSANWVREMGCAPPAVPCRP